MHKHSRAASLPCLAPRHGIVLPGGLSGIHQLWCLLTRNCHICMRVV